MIKKGDIVLVSFPFTNLKGTKRRPAVILFVDDLDVIAVFITSKINIPNSNEQLLKPSAMNRLKMTSLIKTTKICTLDKKLIRGKLGELSKDESEQLNQNLKKIFEL